MADLSVLAEEGAAATPHAPFSLIRRLLLRCFVRLDAAIGIRPSRQFGHKTAGTNRLAGNR